MTAPLESTWASRELPILRAALKRLDAGEQWADLGDIRNELGFDEAQMRAGLKALESASPPYIQATYYFAESPNQGAIQAVSERVRRELGTWPSAESLVDRLAAALAEAADAEEEPERKSKLRAAADALGGFVRDVAVGVVAAQVGR